MLKNRSKQERKRTFLTIDSNKFTRGLWGTWQMPNHCLMARPPMIFTKNLCENMENCYSPWPGKGSNIPGIVHAGENIEEEDDDPSSNIGRLIRTPYHLVAVMHQIAVCQPPINKTKNKNNNKEKISRPFSGNNWPSSWSDSLLKRKHKQPWVPSWDCAQWRAGWVTI